MADQNIINYIKAAINQGDKQPQIEQTLFAAGWQKNQIKEAFDTIQKSAPLDLKPATGVELIDYKSIAIFLAVFDFFTIFRANEIFTRLNFLNCWYITKCTNPAYQSTAAFNLLVSLLAIAVPAFIVVTLVNKNLKIAFFSLFISGIIILIGDLIYASSHFYLSHILANFIPVGLGSANLALFFFVLLCFFMVIFKLLEIKLKISKYQDGFFTVILLIFLLYSSLSLVAPLTFYKVNSKIFAPVNNYLYSQIVKSETKQNSRTSPQIPKTNNYLPNNY